MMINVLVAEDEPLILNSITKLIHSLDSDFIVCARAKNGLEVLQCLNSQPINIIFTDIKMPLLNGLDLIQEIRNRSLNVPIVILSGYNDFSYAKKALKLGVAFRAKCKIFSRHLQKPILKTEKGRFKGL